MPCPECGSPTVRFMSSAPHMFRDTFGTPLVDSTMDKETQVFQSRSEHKAAMKARGLALMDQHVPLPGTDKSPHTTKWESGRAATETERKRAERLANDENFQAARRAALERADWKHELMRHE